MTTCDNDDNDLVDILVYDLSTISDEVNFLCITMIISLGLAQNYDPTLQSISGPVPSQAF